ncbi:MAG: aldo/keto reductase [Treponema sp.]|jgi:predicted aldo/keto reductase-like oxidoreductase|nr:aldo/keto reductase [Treponema sp.]
MLYKKFQDMNLSRLGMGNMRLPKLEGNGEAIDEIKARRLIEEAYASGINYFDTAYRYHAGQSERVTGMVLNQFPRDSFYLATKMPGHMMNYENGKFNFTGLLANFPSRSPSEVFEEQLEKCRVDYFDFYLLHNICETSYEFYTNEEIGVIAYLLEQKQKGRIRHLGFSAHGQAQTIEKFLVWSESRFPDGCFEIAQIQLNYLDWTLQNAGMKYEILTKRRLPVVVMEPCRGGKLASFNDRITTMLKTARPGDSIASWAFRFINALPNVQVTLSGMSSLEQLRDNLKTFSDPSPLTDDENAVLQKTVAALVDMVPCTGCRYCTGECPQRLNIPGLISIYNEIANGESFSWNVLDSFTLSAMTEAELPSNCSGCGNCKQICPQGIDIPEIMRKLAEAIDENNRRKSKQL